MGTYQVAVQHFVGDWANGIDHEGTNCDVGHKAAIHHINVDPVTACLINGTDLQPSTRMMLE